MGIFNSILQKLGLKKKEEEAPVAPKPAPVKPAVTGPAQPHPVTPPAPKPAAPKPIAGKPVDVTPDPKPVHFNQGMSVPIPPSPAVPAPAKPDTSDDIPMVDVMGKLKKMAAANPEELNWRTSIVDLLKLLELDSSLAARKELAVELGCPADKMDDNVKMNTWLHKAVLQALADNGGNIPKDMLD